MPRPLRIEEAFEVPLREISGLTIQRAPGRPPRLVAIGDESFEIVWTALGPGGPEAPFSRRDVFDHVRARAKRGGSQWEAVASDAIGRLFVLQEDPGLVFVLDPDVNGLVAAIELEAGRGTAGEAWDASGNSRGEGLLPLSSGHFLIVKEKDPPELIEFGPEGDPPAGIRPAAYAPSTFPLASERATFVALARWDLSRRDLRDIEDLSDVAVGPDGALYLLSDQGRCLLRIVADLGPEGGKVEIADRWELPKAVKKPEGLVLTDDLRPLVAIDRDGDGKNLFLLERLRVGGPSMFALRAAVTAVHALASAAWFGAMFYSFTVLHPRARAFFETDRDFEDFISFVSAGARWKVLGAFGLVALSGAGLTALTSSPSSGSAWLALVVAKIGLWLVALVVFVYTSWRLWPRRILAGPNEVPGLQRTFRRVGATMLALVGASFVLGVAAHALRG